MKARTSLWGGPEKREPWLMDDRARDRLYFQRTARYFAALKARKAYKLERPVPAFVVRRRWRKADLL